MGRKSRKRAMIKPFCYFCGREFDNEKVLIQHQKARHFKCAECNRKLETAHGLLVHMQQVHKMVQRRVPNAMDSRDNINSMIQGMNGIPLDVIEEHQLRHSQKMGDMNSRKQQRISWTQVAMAPSVEQFVSQMRTGNTYFPGFTNGPDITKSQPVTNNILKPQTSSIERDFGGFKPATSNTAAKPLILGPTGVPIETPINNVSVPKPSLPSQISVQGVFQSRFSHANEKPSTRGFSDSLEPHVPKGFSDGGQTSSTVVYKNCGVAPLFIPTPALSNTKLAYSSDSVSIEELRAKIAYNWHEGV